MAQFVQPSNGKGSLKDIQNLINLHSRIINDELQMRLKNQSEIEWVSPLADDNFAEYRDKAFLSKLGLESLTGALKEFWPNNGPQWDALGKVSGGKGVILVEAKANIPEIVSPPCGAKSTKSINLIHESLQKTKEYIGSTSRADWSSYFYQYTNRLAHLYYLRVLNNIPAYLVFVYFIGDTTVDGPKTKAEWLAALTVMKEYLGIKKNHKLCNYIMDLFVDFDKIKEIKRVRP